MVQGAGRRDDLIGAAYGALGNKTGTSIFSPTLAEICCRWWCPRPWADGRPIIVLDTSCGDVTRGANGRTSLLRTRVRISSAQDACQP